MTGAGYGSGRKTRVGGGMRTRTLAIAEAKRSAERERDLLALLNENLTARLRGLLDERAELLDRLDAAERR